MEIPSAPPEAAQHLVLAAQDLAACGFVAAAHFRIDLAAQGPNKESYLSLWRNDAASTIARVIWARFAVAHVQYTLTSFALAFTTTLDDGRELITTNALTNSTYPPDPMVDVVRWRGMNHAPTLFKLHAARIERLRGGVAVMMPDMSHGAIERLVRKDEEAFVKRAIEIGYLRRDASGAVLRTLRGSYLMTWRILWPWKQLIARRQDRKLQRTLAEFPEVMAAARDVPPSPPALRERIG